MEHIPIFEIDTEFPDDPPRKTSGWFNPAAAACWQNENEELRFTATGRWLIKGRHGERYVRMEPEAARQWLVDNGYPTPAQQYFDETEPRGVGQPYIGPVVPFRLSEEDLVTVDRLAAVLSISRAAMLRRIVTTHLQAQADEATP